MRRADSESDQKSFMEFSELPRPVRTAKSVRETINQDGAVLLDIKQGLCFSMNPMGARIWEKLKKECPLDQIAEDLELEFSAPRNQIEADICEFIENLATRKLVRYGNEERTQGKSWFSWILLRSPLNRL